MPHLPFSVLLERDVLLFIKLVKAFPQLYDKNCKGFKNERLKARTWAKISRTLEFSVQNCQELWRYLRNRYMEEKRSIQGQTYSSDWEYYNEMNFLKRVLKRRKRSKKSRSRKIKRQEIMRHSSTEVPILNGDSQSSSASDNLTVLDNGYGISTPEELINFINNLRAPMTDTIPDTPGDEASYYHLSEESFGALVTSKLREIPLSNRPEIRMKIFHILELD